MQAIMVDVYENVGVTSTQQQPMPISSVSVQGTTPGKQRNIEEEAAKSKLEDSNFETKRSNESKVTK